MRWLILTTFPVLLRAIIACFKGEEYRKKATAGQSE